MKTTGFTRNCVSRQRIYLFIYLGESENSDILNWTDSEVEPIPRVVLVVFFSRRGLGSSEGSKKVLLDILKPFLFPFDRYGHIVH